MLALKRPLLIRLLPDRYKQSLYYRHYRTRHTDWAGLFKVAPLAFAPGVAMYDLLPGDEISGNIAFNGFYELALSRQIAKLASEESVFVDVGANMGYFSLLWAGRNKSGRVIAFEAAPRNVKLLQNNIAQNHLADRITLIPRLAGNQTGTATFDVGRDDQTGWGGISSASSASTIALPVVRLDEEIANTSIDVLKIDVEGADTWVLQGCEALLRARKVKTIFFEQNLSRMNELGISPSEAQTFLRDLRYTCQPISTDQSEWMAFPKTQG